MDFPQGNFNLVLNRIAELKLGRVQHQVPKSLVKVLLGTNSHLLSIPVSGIKNIQFKLRNTLVSKISLIRKVKTYESSKNIKKKYALTAKTI